MATIRLSDISLTRGPPRLAAAWGSGASATAQPFALRNLTLTVPHGETLAVLGPSGCGKSTLLRIIAGLEAPDSGRVLYNGQDVAGIPPGERRIGYLFQSYALYPHFTSRENITSYFLFRRKTPEMERLREEKFRRTSELLDVDVSYLLDRRPARLSGGEQQRVALGRCITREPELFLLDEPFSNLDAKLRGTYRLHLKTLLREFGITTVYVTHDQQEAVLLGDRIAVMRTQRRTGDSAGNEGTVEQVGTVQELYDHPVSAFVAEFLLLHGDGPAISLLPGAALAPELAEYTLGVRPEQVRVAAPEDSAPSVLSARVSDVREDPLRQHRTLTLDLNGTELVARVAPDTPAAAGDTVALRLRGYHLFRREDGAAAHPSDAARRVLDAVALPA